MLLMNDRWCPMQCSLCHMAWWWRGSFCRKILHRVKMVQILNRVEPASAFVALFLEYFNVLIRGFLRFQTLPFMST